MPMMKDSGITWIGEVPTHWNILPLKYNYAFISGGTPDSSNPDNWDGNIKWITPADFKTKDIFVAEGARKLTDNGYRACSATLLPVGSIVFSKRAPIGSVAITTQELCTNQGCLGLIKKNNSVNNKFFYYVLSIYPEVFNLFGSGTTFKEISATVFGNVMLQQPPLPEQQAIADYLDAKCAEIDALTADIQAQIDTLEEYKRSVITEAVTKGLNKDVEMQDSGIEWASQIPKHWEILKGKYIFKQRNDRGNSKNLQLLSPTQNFGVIPQSKYEELTGMSAVKLKEDVDLSALKTIHSGDYCISLRSFQGGFEYSTYEGVVSPAYQVFYAAYRQIDDRYFKYMFKEKGFIEKMNSYTLSLRDGKNIAFADFGNSYLPIPPLDEQKRIADFIDCKVADINAIISAKQEQLTTLDEYKKSTIYEYVTGKKEVPNE